MAPAGKRRVLTGEYGDMNTNRRHAVAALIAAGLLWGTTVPLSKLALEWLAPGWLTVVRFGLAAAILLAVARPRGGRGGGAPGAGGGLVLAWLLLSARARGAQGRLRAGRDPIAVTAVQFRGAALASLPVAALSEGVPAAPAGAGVVLAVVALALAGTLLPVTLFAFGQSRGSAQGAGAFLNLEPLVGAIAGAVVVGDP